MAKRKHKPLAKPNAFVEPCLRQAWADYKVAIHLVRTPLKDRIHKGQPPYHAAIAKFQQSLEKALKAALLQFAPAQSSKVFLHRFLSDKDVMNCPDVKGAFDKIFQCITHESNIKMDLENLEKIIPDPRIDSNKSAIIHLPENSEYPYTDGQGNPIAPCDGFAVVYSQKFPDTAKNVLVFLRAMARMPEFRLTFKPLLGQ